MNAEQYVLDAVVLDQVAAAFDHYAGIDAVVRFAAASDAQAAQRDIRAADADHRALAAAVDLGLAAAVERQRFGDVGRTGVATRCQSQDAAG
jgi:hypothetical protein